MKDDQPVFVDTNILVYAFDRAETRRRRVAAGLLRELAEENRLCLSTQVLQEFFVTVTRKIRKPLKATAALELLDDFAVWPLFVVDYEAIREAGMLSPKIGVSYWDALILVAARRSGAVIVYSEDLNHGQDVNGLRIVNPFLDPE